MITCFLRYEIDPAKVRDFEEYGRMWIRLVNKLGGKHHGYLLPSEGASKAAWEFGERTQCIRRWDRSFFRPVFE